MKPWALALAGFALVAGAVVGDTLLLGVAAIRNGWWTYLAIVPGVALAVAAIAKERSWATIVIGVVAFLAAALYTLTRFIPTPKGEPAVANGAYFPDFFYLKDQEGRDRSLLEFRREGPVVVVLFRGRW